MGKNWIREEGVGAEERGTEGKNDTAWYHRHTVEFAVGKVARGNKEIKTAVLRRISHSERVRRGSAPVAH